MKILRLCAHAFVRTRGLGSLGNCELGSTIHNLLHPVSLVGWQTFIAIGIFIDILAPVVMVDLVSFRYSRLDRD